MTQGELTFTSHPDKRIGEGQSRDILNALEAGEEITAMDALQQFGCFRLAARIKDIRYAGFDVKDRWRKLDSGKKIKVYFI